MMSPTYNKLTNEGYAVLLNNSSCGEAIRYRGACIAKAINIKKIDFYHTC